MLPFEITNITLTTLALAALLSNRNHIYFLLLLLSSTIILICQYYLEGIRWQFFPSLYLLPILFITYKKFKNRIPRVVIGLLFFWLFIALILPLSVPVFSLPEPSGDFTVGTETFHWVDSSRLEWFTEEDKEDNRQIMVQAWYPTIKNKTLEPSPYLDFINLRATSMASAGKIPEFLPSHLSMIKTNSIRNVPCVGKNSKYPVLIFSHGITGSRHLHQVLFEHLASNGYIVFAPDHSYDSNLSIFPSGFIANYKSEITGHPDSINIRKKQINTRTLDIVFILNQIEKINNGLIESHLINHLDLTSIAVGGHSYGGGTATFASHIDKRIKACIALDGWINPVPDSVLSSGLKIPFLFMGRMNWNESDYPNNYEKLDTLIKQSSNVKHRLFIKKTLHLDFTDIPLFSPFISYVMDVGPLSPKRTLPLINNIVHGFLEKHLLNKLSSSFRQSLNDELVITY